jgi:K+-sensing histidine kinase KdpD
MSLMRARDHVRDRRWLLRQLVAALLSLGAVAVVSLAVWVLEPHAPVVSLGVLYLFAVLPVAAIWGLPFAIPVSIVSMLVFNWLFLPPTHTLRLEDSENWVALAVYLVTAISVSALSDRARRRTVEAELRRREAERAIDEARASEERRLREAVEAEALRRSDAVKTAVLRSVSHDLRSPITAITTASEVLRELGDSLSDDDRNELVAAILAQVQRLDRLVANLLELSRLEAGAAVPARELWTVDGLVARALDVIAADERRVDVDLPDDIPPVEVDPGQLERALVNVIENALKFSGPDERVTLRGTTTAGDVFLRVTDHGPGIAPHERERVFEPFVRGSSANGDRGSGLGLAIARGFVGVNGGRLWVEPAAGGGSEFVLVLPGAALPAQVTA